MSILYSRNCDICNNPYKGRGNKFCSRKCFFQYFKLNPSRGMLGKRQTKEHKDKISKSLKGKLPKNIYQIAGWNKGVLIPNPTYSGLHDWKHRVSGYPLSCGNCGKIGERVNGRWNIEWANKDHKYKRDVSDWLKLCAKCHRKYDRSLIKI